MEKCGKSAQKSRKNVEKHPKNLWKNVENHYLCIAKYTDYEIFA